MTLILLIKLTLLLHSQEWEEEHVNGESYPCFSSFKAFGLLFFFFQKCLVFHNLLSPSPLLWLHVKMWPCDPRITQERTTHWSVWFCGWSCIASGMLIIEVQFVHSGSLEHHSDTTAGTHYLCHLVAMSKLTVASLSFLLLDSCSSLSPIRTMVSPHLCKENFWTHDCDVGRVFVHI